MITLTQKTFNNVAYNSVAKIVSLIFQGVASIILARTLLPSDYGIVGFAMIFVNFLSLFNDMGVNSAVIQRKELSETELYTGFSIRFGMGIIIYMVAFLFSGISTAFFDNPAIIGVIKILSLNFIIQSFGFLPSTMLKRNLNYKKLSLTTVYHTLTYSLLSVTLALMGFGYWSIVIAGMFANIVYVVSLNVMAPVKIRLLFERITARQFIIYGGSISLTGLTVFAIFNLDNFIIGTVEGSITLGFYMIAFNWGSTICTMLGSVINSVLFPTFSKIQSEGDRIKSAYLRVMEYTSFIGVLSNITLFLLAREFLVYVLGSGTDKWLPALDSFRILCVYGIIRFMLEPIGSVIMATGRVGLLLKATILTAIVEISLLYPALKYFGLEGVASVVTFAYALQYFIYFRYLRRDINITFSHFIRSVRPALISGGALAAFMLVLSHNLMESSLIAFVMNSVACVTIYFLIHGIVTKWKLAKEIKHLVINMRTAPGKS